MSLKTKRKGKDQGRGNLPVNMSLAPRFTKGGTQGRTKGKLIERAVYIAIPHHDDIVKDAGLKTKRDFESFFSY